MSKQLEGTERTQLIWTVCLIVPQLLAVVSTIFRLIYRKRNQGLWWDDYLASISLVFALMLFASPWLALRQVHPTPRVVSSWLFTFSFPSLVWTTRISLALTLARIMPRQHPIFSVVLYLVFFFGAIALAIVIQLMVAYGRDTSWMHAPPYICVPSRATIIFMLSADLVGDMLLISVPLRLFWHAKLLPVQLFLVKIGFAASILTSTFSITCAVLLLTPADSEPGKLLLETSLTHIMAALSLLVCNVLVIITFLYRYFRRHEEEEPSTSPKTPTSTKITHHQYTSTYPSEFTTFSILPSSSEPTYASDMGYLHTFSSPDSRPHPSWERPREHPI